MTPKPPAQDRIHPAELTLLLTGLIATSYAFGIYLFSTLLPEMRVGLSMSYTTIGWVTGSAQVGFLAGAFISAWLVRYMGGIRLILSSAFTCSVCLGAMSLVTHPLQVAFLMVVTACTAATVWVPMIAVVQNAISIQHQGKVLGLISSGTAYGLFLSGWSTPVLLARGGWRPVWVFASLLTFALFVWGLLRLRLRESKLGLGHATPVETGTNGALAWATLLRRPTAIVVVLLMFLNGLACMPTMNYLVAFLREELGYSAESAGQVWSTIGMIGMVGGFAMGTLADRFTVAGTLCMTYVLLGTSTLLFLSHGWAWQVLLGGALFGLAFNAIFGLIPTFVSQSFDPLEATTIFALSNVTLGLGSMLGNLLGGLLREQQQSFMPVYIGSFGVNLLLIGLCLYLPYSRQSPTILSQP